LASKRRFSGRCFHTALLHEYRTTGWTGL